MERIGNPYFSIELNEEQISNIRKAVSKILVDNLACEITHLPNPHISIHYFIGNILKDEIEAVADEIVEAPFNIKVEGFIAVDSPYYGGTIIALKLIHSDDFLYTQDYLKEVFCNDGEVSFKTFGNGFDAHLSLILIKDLSPEDIELLPRVLELCFSDLGTKTLYGESFCMYNPNREKILEKKFIKA